MFSRKTKSIWGIEMIWFSHLGVSGNGAALFNSLYGFANGCENGLRPPNHPPPAFGLPPHMSLFYWPYPSPPISPNSFYGLHQQPTMVSTYHQKPIKPKWSLSTRLKLLQVPAENGHFLGPTSTPHGSVPPNTMYNGTVQPGSQVNHLHHPSPKDHHHHHQQLARSSNEKTKHSHKATVETNSKRIVEVYPT